MEKDIRSCLGISVFDLHLAMVLAKRKGQLLVLMAIWMLFGGGFASANSDFDVPHIRVYGTAETEVVPDELHWSLFVKTRGSSIENVSKNHAEEVAAVLRYLKQSNIEEDDVRTARMQLKENWVYRNSSRLKEGYLGFTEIDFKTTDFKTYLKHWKGLSSMKNLTINNVRFDISNRTDIQNSTRVLAVKKARAKAKSLVEALGATLMEPLSIQEVDGSTPIPRNTVMVMERNHGNVDQSIAPGKEKVRTTVLVIFRISTNS